MHKIFEILTSKEVGDIRYALGLAVKEWEKLGFPEEADEFRKILEKLPGTII